MTKSLTAIKSAPEVDSPMELYSADWSGHIPRNPSSPSDSHPPFLSSNNPKPKPKPNPIPNLSLPLHSPDQSNQLITENIHNNNNNQYENIADSSF